MVSAGYNFENQRSSVLEILGNWGSIQSTGDLGTGDLGTGDCGVLEIVEYWQRETICLLGIISSTGLTLWSISGGRGYIPI